jgi:hypothetical protein
MLTKGSTILSKNLFWASPELVDTRNVLEVH